MTRPWTRLEDLLGTLRKRWERGLYLSLYAAGEPWTPVVLPVRAPSAAELLNDFDEAVRWLRRFDRESRTASGRVRFIVEQRRVSSRGLGTNDVPARIRLDSFEQLCDLLGTRREVAALDAILEHTDAVVPALRAWVSRNPRLTLEHAGVWDQVLATVAWILEHDTTQLYLRHIDVAGVDTKFVEEHQRLFAHLLVEVLPPGRMDLTQTDFARRFGFLAKPDYTRLRLFAPVPAFPAAVSELRLRTDELARIELPVQTVFVVENEISYLAFPEVPNATVVFGKGFHVATLDAVRWLHRRQIVYWGDIDTHGFAILDRLRARFPTTVSILMDRDTLLAHPNQWVTEATPTAEPLLHLTEQERSVYQDLIEDRFGRRVRLEQERVRFGLLRRALEPWLRAAEPAAEFAST